MLKEKTVEFVKEVNEVKEEAIMYMVEMTGATGIMSMLEDDSGAGKLLAKSFKLMDMSLDLLSEQSEAIDMLVNNNNELNKQVSYLVDLNRSLNKKMDGLCEQSVKTQNERKEKFKE